MKRRKLMVLFFSALTILFIMLSPPFLEDGVTRNIYRQWLSIKQSPWPGVVRLWHIKSWETGQSNGMQWLKSAVASYEKKYPGMYIEVEGMTVQEAQERLQKGEKPDLYSFPLGFVPPGELCPIQAPETIRASFLKTGQQQGQQLALPYMMGGYALIVNRSKFIDHQLLLPSDEDWTAESVHDALVELSDDGKNTVLGYDEEYYMLPGAALLLYAGENITDGSPVKTENAYNTFFSQELGILIGTQKAVTSLRDISVGIGPDIEILGLGGYTDMVQYVAVSRDENDTKNECCIRFAQYLCNNAQQRKLERLNVFPVTQVDIYKDNDVMLQMFHDLQKARIPNCFVWEREKTSLQDIILQGIQGRCKEGEASEELAKALS